MLVGIETDRGPWMQALVATGYTVYPINPLQVARYRKRHGVGGAKSDPGDAHVPAEIVRLDRAHHRPAAGDSTIAANSSWVAPAVSARTSNRSRYGAGTWPIASVSTLMWSPAWLVSAYYLTRK